MRVVERGAGGEETVEWGEESDWRCGVVGVCGEETAASESREQSDEAPQTVSVEEK